ncbi:DUF3040 domain-containing protein [Marisediminicola sp. LYQ134]|uniref:DUF3040 domain-containing protein n=1 Tax=unclassified Marisediminicola TaxID=2618316 RepID=UPI003983A805
MPLSEHEQRLLEEMERNLYQNDADFVATVGAARGRTNYTLIVVGILTAVLGIGLIVTGVITQLPLVGILGFVIMFGGALLAISPGRKTGPPVEPSAAERERSSNRMPTAGRSSGGFMDRMNDRWEKRQDGSDGRE